MALVKRIDVRIESSSQTLSLHPKDTQCSNVAASLRVYLFPLKTHQVLEYRTIGFECKLKWLLKRPRYFFMWLMALKCKMGLPGCVFIVLDLRLIKCTPIVLNIPSQALLLSRHTISAGSSAITCWLAFLIFILLFLKSTAEGYIKREKRSYKNCSAWCILSFVRMGMGYTFSCLWESHYSSTQLYDMQGS